jgi:hypothetical protein
MARLDRIGANWYVFALSPKRRKQSFQLFIVKYWALHTVSTSYCLYVAV